MKGMTLQAQRLQLTRLCGIFETQRLLIQLKDNFDFSILLLVLSFFNSKFRFQASNFLHHDTTTSSFHI